MILYAKSFRYCFDEKGVFFKRGILRPFSMDVSYARVQNIIIDNTHGMEHIYGIATLTIQTAAKSRKRLSIPGLSIEDAEDIKQYVFERISGSSVKDSGLGL